MNKQPKKPASEKKPKIDKNQELVNELTADLQRLRADFENYRKRSELDKQAAKDYAKQQTVLKLLPTIDNLNRALGHIPTELADNKWANGVAKLPHVLEKDLKSLGVEKIAAGEGVLFNPELHDAIQMDENAEGDTEVIAEELQTGYAVDGQILRPAMVRVTRRS